VLTGVRLGELSGTQLGAFHVGLMLARGQSGMVFRARNTRDGRTVALKVLWPEFSRHDTEVRRFVRSMRTMLPLHHPNLVTLLGAGKKGPYCWVAMEYVEGGSLAEFIRTHGAAGRLDWRHAHRVGYHLARALEYAHARHVLHRNLTPNNVLLRREDSLTKLGDLMLAKALEGGLAEQLTRPGELLGDVRFMSPERTRGDDLDARADLYSLGALLYTMLTGHPPFEGSSLVETVTAIRDRPPEPPRKFQLSTPERFQDTVLKLLAKRPEARHPSAAALLADLDKVAKFHDVRL
jgi:serine/threonine protein kinase